MAARRLVIVMLVLLGVSTLAAALVPSRSRLRQGSSTETETTVPRDTVPRGELLAATIVVGGSELPIVRLERGDQLELTVCSDSAGQIEIPAFGLLEDVDPFSPARFDILALETGTFAIRLVGREGAAGRLEVRGRSAEGAAPPERATPGAGPTTIREGTEPGVCPDATADGAG